MTQRRIQFLSLLFLLRSALAFDSDFSFYSPKVQPCLNSASKASKCSGATAKALNVCLCGNGGNFITRSAQCLGRQDIADVQSAYSTMFEACNHSETPMTVSEQEFFDVAAGNSKTTSSVTSASSATSTSTSTSSAKPTSSATSTSSATPTSSATSTSSATPTATDPATDKDNKPGGGLSKGTVIGIAVGAAAVGVLGTLVLVMVCIRRRRQQAEVESHPMLGQSEYYHNTPTTFPPNEPSSGLGHYAADQKSAWGASPSPGLPSPQTSPPSQFGTPGAVPHHQSSHEAVSMMTGHQSEMHGNAGQAYELDGLSSPGPAPAPAHLAVEMEGSQPLRRP